MLSSFFCRRFQDEKGNWIDGVGLAYAPRALASCVLRKLFGYRPLCPWLSYRAIRTLDNLIQPQWKILEFGSGMSTLWLARRCSSLHSIESDPDWHKVISQQLARHHLDQVRYELRQQENYADLREYPDSCFDFVLVDGLIRSNCVRQALAKIRAGGWIYLDNCDTDPKGGDMRIAEQMLRDAIGSRKGSCRYFVDYAPTNFHVHQGMLAQL